MPLARCNSLCSVDSYGFQWFHILADFHASCHSQWSILNAIYMIKNLFSHFNCPRSGWIENSCCSLAAPVCWSRIEISLSKKLSCAKRHREHGKIIKPKRYIEWVSSCWVERGDICMRAQFRPKNEKISVINSIRVWTLNWKFLMNISIEFEHFLDEVSRFEMFWKIF